ncbi:F-box protein [Aspergillus chevalieri]|uniref:F-box domain-containing protein n=1 Tax=Aspergillus chevalieri TaxID=182096 RepID=A0A7R7ZJ10_ASPCH|nr:uncharacterized protein ACHE_10298S [Aspergillus chevalieri]BCR82896.1 hypothetical protein ACHE_10298S [Aspergillus chevalieri]
MSSSAGPFHLLPQDCWKEILEYLPVDDRSRVSKTCRALRVSAEPYLYRKITINWDTPRLRTPLQLLRTFFARPELANFVHHVASFRQYYADPEWFGWPSPWHLRDWPREQTAFIDVVDKTIDIIQRARFPNTDEWIQAVYEGDFHVFWTVCISKLHNLRTLRLDYSFVWQGGYPGRMVRHALLGSNNILPRFEALELVDYGGNVPLPEPYGHLPEELEETEGFPSVYNKEQFTGWFYLPALQHLAIWLREITGLKEAKFKCNLGNLRTLVLARSTITEEDALFLLSQTKTLRNLHLGLAYSWPDKSVLQKGELLVQALGSVSETVEKLSVGLDCYPRVYEEYVTFEDCKALCVPFNGFLKNFPRLQSAELPIIMLLGFDPGDQIDLRSVLPATLLELGLRDDLALCMGRWHQLTIYERVQHLHPTYKEATPFLSRIYHRLWSGIDFEEKELQTTRTGTEIRVDIVADELGPGFGPYSYFKL